MKSRVKKIVYKLITKIEIFKRPVNDYDNQGHKKPGSPLKHAVA